MEIRAYTDRDREAVRTMYDLAKQDEMRGSVDLDAVLPLSDDPTHLALFRDSTILIAFEGKDILGFAGYKGSYISWLYVHPAHRRRGVATTLLSATLQHLPRPVTLDVGKNNNAARALYEQVGFVVENEFTRKFYGHDVEVLTLRYSRQ